MTHDNGLLNRRPSHSDPKAIRRRPGASAMLFVLVWVWRLKLAPPASAKGDLITRLASILQFAPQDTARAARGFVSKFSSRVLIAHVGLVVLAIPAWSQTRITDGNIPFLYESRADIRAPDHKLAALISKDYRNADDEFTRHDLLEQIKPVIESRLAQAKQTVQIYLLIGDQLKNYNFDRSAFPTDMSENTYIRFGQGYQVRFDNADQIGFIPLPPGDARSFAGDLRRSRAVTFRVEGTISRAVEDWDRKIVYVRVEKIVLSMKKNKRQIASYDVRTQEP